MEVSSPHQIELYEMFGHLKTKRENIQDSVFLKQGNYECSAPDMI